MRHPPLTLYLVQRLGADHILDENENKVPLSEKKNREQWQTRKVDLTGGWGEKSNVKMWREDLARRLNTEFESRGIDEHLDPNKFVDRGIEKVPQIHLGHKAHKLEKNGIKTRRGDINREIISKNKVIEKLNANIQKLEKEKTSLDKYMQASPERYSYISPEHQQKMELETLSRLKNTLAEYDQKMDEVKKRQSGFGLLTPLKDRVFCEDQLKMLSISKAQAEGKLKNDFEITPDQIDEKIRAMGDKEKMEAEKRPAREVENQPEPEHEQEATAKKSHEMQQEREQDIQRVREHKQELAQTKRRVQDAADRYNQRLTELKSKQQVKVPNAQNKVHESANRYNQRAAERNHRKPEPDRGHSR